MLTMNAEKTYDKAVATKSQKSYVKVRDRKFYLTDAGCGIKPVAFVDEFNNRLFERSFNNINDAFDYVLDYGFSIWIE